MNELATKMFRIVHRSTICSVSRTGLDLGLSSTSSSPFLFLHPLIHSIPLSLPVAHPTVPRRCFVHSGYSCATTAVRYNSSLILDVYCLLDSQLKFRNCHSTVWTFANLNENLTRYYPPLALIVHLVLEESSLNFLYSLRKRFVGIWMTFIGWIRHSHTHTPLLEEFHDYSLRNAQHERKRSVQEEHKFYTLIDPKYDKGVFNDDQETTN